MLELKNISRLYQSGENTLKALDRVSISFRQNEFVSILGPSGSGKTTLLNIIGGLDHYTDGDLKINGISTKNYTDRDWDAHRNRNIGFVFQNYNLIQHQTVLEGFAAGIIGVTISYLLCAAISSLASAFGQIDGIADLSPLHALILILISILLTVFAGAIPAYRASKKDPVEALRSE